MILFFRRENFPNFVVLPSRNPCAENGRNGEGKDGRVREMKMEAETALPA